jgi:hypothetical protein
LQQYLAVVAAAAAAAAVMLSKAVYVNVGSLQQGRFDYWRSTAAPAAAASQHF